VAKGQVLAKTKSRKKEVPGNLIFYEGTVLSQNINEVAAYPQLNVQLTKVDAALGKNPNDPVGLSDRGDCASTRATQGGHRGLPRRPEKRPPARVDRQGEGQAL